MSYDTLDLIKWAIENYDEKVRYADVHIVIRNGAVVLIEEYEGD